MPEGDAELPDDGLPEDIEEDDEEDATCPGLTDVLRPRTESLPE